MHERCWHIRLMHEGNVIMLDCLHERLRHAVLVSQQLLVVMTVARR